MAALGIEGIIVWCCCTDLPSAYKGISTIILSPFFIFSALFYRINTDNIYNTIFKHAIVTAMAVLMDVIAALYNASGAALSIANALYDLFTIKSKKTGCRRSAGCYEPVLTNSYNLCNWYCTCLQWNEPVVLMFILFPIAMDLFEKAKMPRAMG